MRAGLWIAIALLLAGAGAWLALRPRGVTSGGSGGPSVRPAPVTGPELAATEPPPASEESDEEYDESDDDIPAAPVRLLVRVRTMDETPVPGARIEARVREKTWSATADAAGAAGMDVLSGALRLRVTAERFAGMEWLLWPDAREGPEHGFEAVLEPGLPFEGRVLDAGDGSVVMGAEIAVESVRKDVSLAPFVHVGATSGADGRFQVPGVPVERPTTVRVSARGYVPRETKVEATRVAVWPNPLELHLVRCGRLVGTVRDADGEPVVAAEVRVTPPDAEVAPLKARTDGKGEYVIEGLTFDLEYRATASSDAWAAPERAESVRVTKERPESLCNLRLRETGTLDVVLLDAEGKAVTSGVVEVVTLSGELRRQSGPTDDEVYRFVLLEPGLAQVSARSAAFVPTETSTTVASGTSTLLTVRIDVGARVEGVTVGKDGEPLAGVLVEVAPWALQPQLPSRLDEWVSSRTTQTDAEGRFVIAGVAPGDVWLRARRQSWSDRREAEPRRLRAPTSALRVVLSAYPTATWAVRFPSGAVYEGRAKAQFTFEDLRGSNWRVEVDPLEGGVFHMSGIEPGTCRLELRVPGYLPVVSRTVTVRLGEHVDLGEVQLDPGFRITGVVLGPDDVGVEGVAVRREGGFTGSDSLYSGFGGRFVLVAVPGGRTAIVVRTEGFAPSRTIVDVGASTPPLKIVLARGALVRGRVEFPDHTPAPERVVVAHVLREDGTRGPDEEDEYSGTNADGAFELRLPRGRWQFASENEIGEVLLGDVTLVDGETRPVTFTIPRR
jgi:hypothetical protein